jgi:biopolymer transport protein ExbD
LAFERRIGGSKEVPLVSFMDMIFNLLLFFLVASYIATNSKVEKRFIFPTPKNELGTAEVFIQWIDERSVFWIDQGESVEVQRVLNETSFLNPEEQSRTLIENLMNRNRLDGGQLSRKVESLVRTADADPGKKYFVLLRCPNPIPYSQVLNVVARLSDARYGNIEYGTSGGTPDELRLGIVETKDAEGNLRKLIRIDFTGNGA